jgi:hypothetical protein
LARVTWRAMLVFRWLMKDTAGLRRLQMQRSEPGALSYVHVGHCHPDLGLLENGADALRSMRQSTSSAMTFSDRVVVAAMPLCRSLKARVPARLPWFALVPPSVTLGC